METPERLRELRETTAQCCSPCYPWENKCLCSKDIHIYTDIIYIYTYTHKFITTKKYFPQEWKILLIILTLCENQGNAGLFNAVGGCNYLYVFGLGACMFRKVEANIKHLSQSLSTLFFESVTEPGVCQFDYTGSEQDPSILQSLAFPHGDYKHTLLRLIFYMDDGGWIYVLTCVQQMLYHWVLSPVTLSFLFVGFVVFCLRQGLMETKLT